MPQIVLSFLLQVDFISLKNWLGLNLYLDDFRLNDSSVVTETKSFRERFQRKQQRKDRELEQERICKGTCSAASNCPLRAIAIENLEPSYDIIKGKLLGYLLPNGFD